MGPGAWRAAVQGPEARDEAEWQRQHPGGLVCVGLAARGLAEVSQPWEGVAPLLEACCP